MIQSATFKYDVFGNRVEEEDYNASTQVTTVTKFACDAAGNIRADLNSSNQLVDRRLYVAPVSAWTADRATKVGCGSPRRMETFGPRRWQVLRPWHNG